MPRGHACLCALMDCHSRKVLGWALSNTTGTDLCLEALEMALKSTGKVPGIFNTDQGCQFTSAEWTGKLSDLGVKISMDGQQFTGTAVEDNGHVAVAFADGLLIGK